MKLVDEKIALREIKEMANKGFGDMVKAVVDVDKQIVAIDMELHADGEAELLKSGSKQASLWGINIYPDAHAGEMIEYRSMINVRPLGENNSLIVENPRIQKQIAAIVGKLIGKNA